MTDFPQHTLETAPQETAEDLKAVEARFGFLPNIYGVLAESPATLRGYLSLSAILGESSFSPPEQQLMLLCASIENGCDYCVAAHTLGGCA